MKKLLLQLFSKIKKHKNLYITPLFVGIMILGVQQTYFPINAIETQTFTVKYSGDKIQGESVWYQGHGGYWYSWGYDPPHNTSDYFWIEKVSTANNGDVTYRLYAGLRCHGKGSDHVNPSGTKVWQGPYEIKINNKTFNISPNGQWWDRDIDGNGCWKNGGGNTFKTTLKAGQTYQISVYVKNKDGQTASQWNGSITIPQVSYYQNIQARYQNADGTWGNYSSVKSGNANYNTTYSWSRAADGTYKAASVSYKVTQANTKYVDVYRQVYTDSIDHWMWGFTNGEGNNGDKRAWKIKTTSFTKRPGQGYTLGTGDAVRVPNGFKLSNTFGTASINGKWTSYNLGYSGLQPTGNMYVEFDYAPISYNISYNMNGGTNSSSNPSTYNVLYGVNFATPTRTGYSFVGWYIDGNKVSGINVGANASFSSESDMYSKLDSRTTGNKTVEARWLPKGYTVKFNGNGANSGSMSNQNFIYNESKALNSNSYSKTGYTFNGWNTQADGSGTKYSNSQTVKNLSTGGASLFKDLDTSRFDSYDCSETTVTHDGWVTDSALDSKRARKITVTHAASSGGVYSDPLGNYTSDWKNFFHGKKYTITFKAKADRNMNLRTVGLECSRDPFTNISLTTNWQTYTISGMIDTTTAYHALIFYAPSTTGSVYIGDLNVTVDSEVNLYAQWSPNAYTLTLNPNGGSIDGSTSEKTLNPPLYYDGGNWWNVSANEPSRNGYRFMGWYTSAEGGTKIYNTDGTCTNDGTYWKDRTYVYTGNLKVYAHWKYITYYIQYDLNDSDLIDKVNYSVTDNNGSLSGHETALFDDDYALQDPQPTTKYIFKGWNTKADGSGKMYTKYINQDGSVCSAGNTLKLYAIWETTPTMKAKDFYLIEEVPVPSDIAYSGVGFDKTPTEKYPDKMTKVTYPIKGTTMNGTDITDRIKIDYIELNGTKVSSIDTNKTGKYTIHYSLTDGKDTKKFTRNITVLPASTPNINAGDKYFKKNTNITIDDLKENISANDKYDGDLVTEVEIKDKNNINENESGVYEITYSVINTSNKTTTKKVNIHIIDYLPDNEADAGHSFRYIRKDCSEANDYCLQYFASDSKWNTDDTLKDMLMDSLSKADDQTPVKKYSFKANDVERAKSSK